MLRVNRKRLEATFELLGRLGETPKGGLSRLALLTSCRASQSARSVTVQALII